MNFFGKTIRLFLVEGNTNSLVTAELSNWTGIGIRVPKIKVKEFSARHEFQKAGVYILFGKNDNNEDAAYIGEAEVIYDRLVHHIANKEFWNEVVFFCSKDKYLNKASVKYLENRLHDLANRANRYKLDQNIPTKSELSEAEQAELEEFLSNIKVLTAALGYKIFEALSETIKAVSKPITVSPDISTLPTVDHKPATELSSLATTFYCRNGAGASATGTPSTEGFVVYEGSLFMTENQPSLTESIRQEKEDMIRNMTLISMGDHLKLTKDYVFNSSSRAAAMILGTSASGPREWKTEQGIPLKQLN